MTGLSGSEISGNVRCCLFISCDVCVWLTVPQYSQELIRESPSPALRSCLALAQVYYPLARDLFNAAFYSCWVELNPQYQQKLVHSLETSLLSDSIPPEILQQLLNLAEFMEHDDNQLPIDIRTFGVLAAKCRAFAKALHYKEIEFAQAPEKTIEALISINNQLQQPQGEDIWLFVFVRTVVLTQWQRRWVSCCMRSRHIVCRLRRVGSRSWVAGKRLWIRIPSPKVGQWPRTRGTYVRICE